PYVPVHFAASV
nr:Chain B, RIBONUCLEASE A [Bos taurus]